jgi:calcineurin-like phosphoesterase family protein
MHKGVWHLYGHSHGSLMESSINRSFDVGFNCNDYKLLTFEDVKARMDEKIFKAEDHHR